MAGPALQLFPPPSRPPRQTSPSRKLQFKTSSPVPGMDGRQSTEPAPTSQDFHDLIIKVNSVPVSPAASMVPQPTMAPLPPTFSMATAENSTGFVHPPQSPDPASGLHQHAALGSHNPRAPSPSSIYSNEYGTYRSPYASPVPDRGASPAFSTSATLVRANSTATHFRTASPEQTAPMRSMFPVFDPTKSLSQQAYKPTQASPTHIPMAQISRSPYSPELYVPHAQITDNGPASPPPKPFFTPSNLLDNLWLASNGQADPAVQIYALRMHRATAAHPNITFGTTSSLPFYSLAQTNLAGDHEIPSIMNQLVIQRHHPTQPRVLPVSSLDLMAPPSMDRLAFNAQHQEATSLLTTILPKLAALQALDAAANSPAASRLALHDPGATSPAAQRLAQDVLRGASERESCSLTWSRDNPDQQPNPWAKHLPSEGTYQLHHPTLGTFPIRLEGDCSVINKPSTRPMTAIYGHNMAASPPVPQPKQASITLLNPYILSPSSPRANAFMPLPPPPRMGSMDPHGRPISMTPSEMSVTQLPTTTDASSEDAMLARLDFNNDALILNLGALTRFGNPFLVDVTASALLAVAVAEASRGRSSRQNSTENFEPPPPSFVLGAKKDSDTKAFKDAFQDGYNSWGGKTNLPKLPAKSLRKWSAKSSLASHSETGSLDKDIELGDWYGQKPTGPLTDKKSKKQKKQQDDEEKLPFVTRSIISVLTLLFKAVVFLLRIVIKVIAGVVVMITRNFSRL